MASSIKLPLTHTEKLRLRKEKVKISEVYGFKIDQIAEMLDISDERAKVLKGLADFQSVPSIGLKLAEKLVFQLDIFSLTHIKNKSASELFDQLEQKLAVWTDSCVEDQIRCVIHHANNPKSRKQWFDFTEERKAHREKVGFPDDRPKNAWYE